MHLFVRERIAALSPLFYALPPPVIATLYLGSALGLIAQRRARWAAPCLCAGTLSLCCWLAMSWQWRPVSRPTSDRVRIMFWNTCRGTFGWGRVADRIRFSDLDLIGLVEAGEATAERRGFWENRAHGMSVHVFPEGIVLMARGAILEAESAPSKDGVRLARARVRVARGVLYVILADLPSAPLRDRRSAFGTLHGFLRRQPTDAPTVLMGDFNTPGWSGHFAEIRSRFTHAFDSAGRGLRDTWPIPFPCLSLDHVWVERTVGVIRCEHRTTTASDHRQVVLALDSESLW